MIPQHINTRTFVVTYIGLPDMQYRDVTVWAIDATEAREKADAELLRIYGIDNIDCLEVYEPRFHDN